MSAHLSPEELKRIAPEEYAKQYGEEEADRARLAKTRAETKRLNAETRLLNARRRYENAKATKRKKPGSPRGVAAFVAALIVAVFYIVLIIYIITHF